MAYVQGPGLKVIAAVLVRFTISPVTRGTPPVTVFVFALLGVIAMDGYHIWADFFDTFQSSADWIKALMITVPPAFLLGVLGVVLNFRLKAKQLAEPEQPLPGRVLSVASQDEQHRRLEHETPGQADNFNT